MAVACGVSVANLYYCQPLLADMGKSLGVGARQIGYLPMWTQAGTAVGMFAFVPLGDMLPRRMLIVTMCLAIAAAAILMALAPGIAMVNIAGFLIGVTCIVPHLILPFAAKLAPAETRGHVVGTVLGGLLIGILLARVASGYVGDVFGWRIVYWAAAASLAVLAVALRFALPLDLPDLNLKYRELVESIWRLARTEPVLQEAAITGGMLFGAFSTLWTTLVFFIARPPYHYGARVAGLFGLVGAAGALMAPRAGRLADRRGPGVTVTLAILTTMLSWLVFGVAGTNIQGLIAGVIVLDLGVQAGHVANQTRIYALIPEARSRLNTVYMVAYFLGGALGSALGAYAWTRGGWTGVCVAGAGQCVVALAARVRGQFAAGARSSPAKLVSSPHA